MITCYLRYEVDLGKLADFEAYAKMWLDLMPRFGGIHHGYFLPSEGASDVALAGAEVLGELIDVRGGFLRQGHALLYNGRAGQARGRGLGFNGMLRRGRLMPA